MVPRLHKLRVKRSSRYRNRVAFNLTTARLMRLGSQSEQVRQINEKLGLP